VEYPLYGTHACVTSFCGLKKGFNDNEGVEKQAIFEEKDLKKSVQPVEDT
jgi:hypothetical protein